jgi:16S rRNA (guanine527-N7)-methyltransferase
LNPASPGDSARGTGPDLPIERTSEPVSTPEAIELLRARAADWLGLPLTSGQLGAFAWYLEELLLWNTRHNLTAIVDPAGIAVKHFLDSLTLVPLVGKTSKGRVVDIGSGAGFPGMPVRIVCEGIDLSLIEATGKKAEFCRAVAGGLNLRRVRVLHARAEDVGREADSRESFDVALARAVASLPVLVEYALPLIRVGGRLYAQKGEAGPAEAQQADRAIGLLGGHLKRIHPVELPGVAEPRYIVEIAKVAATPGGYPRRAGVASKRPLH